MTTAHDQSSPSSTALTDRIIVASGWTSARMDSLPPTEHASVVRDSLLAFHVVFGPTRLGRLAVVAMPTMVDALLQRLFDDQADRSLVLDNGTVEPTCLLYSFYDSLYDWRDSTDDIERNFGHRSISAWNALSVLPNPGALLGVVPAVGAGIGSGTSDRAPRPMPRATAPSNASIQDLTDELSGLIGLASVKRAIKREADVQLLNGERLRRNLPSISPSRHMVFKGNPGTGKTTVARLVGQMYHALGILSKGQLVEVGPADMMAAYQGSNTDRAISIIESAVGGVLLVDEAYSLSGFEDRAPMEFAQQVIDTLVKAMEDERADLVVIFTGYSEPMEKFVRTNAGLESRIGEIIHFPDYSDDELTQVFGLILHRHQMTADPEAIDTLREVLSQVPHDDRFGNARLVRNIFEDATAAMAGRVKLTDMADMSDAELGRITSDDILAAAASMPRQLGTERSSFGFRS